MGEVSQSALYQGDQDVRSCVGVCQGMCPAVLGHGDPVPFHGAEHFGGSVQCLASPEVVHGRSEVGYNHRLPLAHSRSSPHWVGTLQRDRYHVIHPLMCVFLWF